MRTILKPLAVFFIVIAIGTVFAVSRARVKGDGSASQTNRPAKATPTPTPSLVPTATVSESGSTGSAISVCCTSPGWTLKLGPTTGIIFVSWTFSPTGLPGSFSPISGASGVPTPPGPFATNINPPTNLCGPAPVTYYYQAAYTTHSVSALSNIVSVTVFPQAQGGPLTATPPKICNDGHSTSTINLGGPVVGTVNWYVCPGTGSAIQVGGTSLTVGPLTADTCYQAAITSGPCTLILTITVKVVQMPVAGTISIAPAIMCVGHATTLSSVGATGNIAWYSAPAVLSPPIPLRCKCPPLSSFTPMSLTGVMVNTNILTESTCYVAQVSDPAGICPPVWSNILPVNVDLPPSPPTLTGPPFICCNGKATINLSPGPIAIGCTPTAPSITFQLFNLSTGAPGINVSPGPIIVTGPGNYQVIAKNMCGVVDSNIITIKPDDLAVTIAGPCCDCKGVPITLAAKPTGGVGPYTYSWSTGATAKTITVSPTVTTTYTVTVTDSIGCKATVSFTVTVCG